MYKRISVTEAKAMQATGNVQFVDIRDEESYHRGHIPQSIHLTQANLQAFLESADLDKPLLVCCYHGNSSQPTANFLNEKGFEDVYSIDGGFEAWKQHYEIEAC